MSGAALGRLLVRMRFQKAHLKGELAPQATEGFFLLEVSATWRTKPLHRSRGSPVLSGEAFGLGYGAGLRDY